MTPKDHLQLVEAEGRVAYTKWSQSAKTPADLEGDRIGDMLERLQFSAFMAGWLLRNRREDR